jgi:uncharacterized protein YoxC
MRSLVENLDSTKEELLKRLQNSTKETQDELSDKAILANDLQNYKHIISEREQQINDLKQSVGQLDSQLDDMQMDLDSKTEELQKTK